MTQEPQLNQRHLVITVDDDDGSVSWDAEGFQAWEAVGLLESIAAEMKMEFIEGAAEELE